MISNGGTTRRRGVTLDTYSSKSGACDGPVRNRESLSYEETGNTEPSQARGNDTTFFLEIPHIDIPRHRGAVCQVFGFADEYIFTGEGLLQENWETRGLFINYQWLDRRNGIANLLVAITRDDTKNQYFRVLMRLSRKPLLILQGVLA